MKPWILGVLVLGLAGILGAQEPPGLRFWDTRTALKMLGEARVLTQRLPNQPPRNIWIKTLKVYLMAPKRWGIKINGEIYDWRDLYVNLGGREVSLSLAFQYAEEVQEDRLPQEFELNRGNQDRP